MRILRELWRLLQEASGERAYRTYCEHVRAHHPGRPVPSEQEFYVQRLRDKYAGVSRCC